jgi:hypothetical protein
MSPETAHQHAGRYDSPSVLKYAFPDKSGIFMECFGCNPPLAEMESKRPAFQVKASDQ